MHCFVCIYGENTTGKIDGDGKEEIKKAISKFYEKETGYNWSK